MPSTCPKQQSATVANGQQRSLTEGAELGPRPIASSLTLLPKLAVELMEVIALAQAGRIQPEVERFPLEEAHSAYRRMRDGQLRGRAVITPSAA